MRRTPALTLPLFEEPRHEVLEPGAVLLRSFALPRAVELISAITAVARDAPFRRMTTTRGRSLSAAMTNCGALGWLSDAAGYRYAGVDPSSGRPWPAMPALFATLANEAAAAAGFAEFVPDACLINRYEPGAKMALHQDKNERHYDAPIVSVSLGLPATFLWGGDARTKRPRRVPLSHGDVVVWGGPARLRFHGVAPIAVGEHPLTGAARLNLTLRRAA